MSKSRRAEVSERKTSDDVQAERRGNVKPARLAYQDEHYDWLEKLEAAAAFRSEQKAQACRYEDEERRESAA